MSTIDDPSLSAAEIFELYQDEARRVHVQSADQQQVRDLRYQLHEIVDFPTDRAGKRHILNEIDMLLWQGKITLQQLGITRDQWIETCVICKFYSAYVRHAVPVAFKQERVFSHQEPMEDDPQHILLLNGKNYMDSEFMPRRIMEGYLLPPGGLARKVDQADMLMFGPHTISAVHFLQELTATAILTLAELKITEDQGNALIN